MTWHWMQGTVSITDEVFVPGIGNCEHTFTRPKLLIVYGSRVIGTLELDQALLAELITTYLNSQRIKPF